MYLIAFFIRQLTVEITSVSRLLSYCMKDVVPALSEKKKNEFPFSLAARSNDATFGSFDSDSLIDLLSKKKKNL